MESHPKWNYQAVAEVLFDCGKNALKGQAQCNYKLKTDGTLVTGFDVENEKELRELLTATLPSSLFLGEESLPFCSEDYLKEAFRGDCWVVDPIDGTAPYAHGYPMWAVSVGLMHGGVLTDGGVFMPGQGEMLVTNGPDVLVADGIDVLHGGCPKSFRKLELPPFGWNNGGMLLLGQEVTRCFAVAVNNPVLATGSAVQALASLLLGRGILYVGTVKLYDVAGIFPMLPRLGLKAYIPELGDISMNVAGGEFDLAADSPTRWKLRGAVRVTSPQAAEGLEERLKLKRL